MRSLRGSGRGLKWSWELGNLPSYMGLGRKNQEQAKVFSTRHDTLASYDLTHMDF